jgi:folate-binding protein YgfZ
MPRADGLKIGEELKTLGAKSTEGDAAARERISSGIPLVPVDIGLNDLPNEGGLDAVAISYTKGCYLGQEVMARLKNLGQVRRHLHIVRGPGAAPQVGALLFQNDHKVGDVRSVARDGDGFVAMVMLSLVNLTATGGLSLAAGAAVPEISITRRV